MPEVGSTSILARCLTYEKIWQEYGRDLEFKKCIWPGVVDPSHKVGVRAISVDSYKKFPLLFENVIQLIHSDIKTTDEPNKCYPSNFGPIPDFECDFIDSISISFSRNFEPGVKIPMKDQVMYDLLCKLNSKLGFSLEKNGEDDLKETFYGMSFTPLYKRIQHFKALQIPFARDSQLGYITKDP